MFFTFQNPCKNCVVLAGCTKECDDYKKFYKTITEALPGISTTINSIVFIIAVVSLYIKFDEPLVNTIISYYFMFWFLVTLYLSRKQKHTKGFGEIFVLLLGSSIYGPTILVAIITRKFVGPVKPPYGAYYDF